MSCCDVDGRLARLTVRFRKSLLLAALACAAVAAAPRPGTAADVTVDRAFGHLVGDIVEARAVLTLPEGARLDDGSIPRPGRLNAWLNLLSVDVARDGPVLRISRRFQVTASAEQVKLLYLPAADIRYRLDGQDRAERLPAQPISVSPLSNRSPIHRAGLGDLRPDRPAPLPARDPIDRALRLAVAGLAVALVLAAGLRWRARRLAAFAPFRQAAAELAKRRRRGTAADLDDGYRAVHRAFDEAAGHAVFLGNVDAFLREHPRFGGEREAIRAFFGRSTVRFFDRRPAAAGVAAADAGDASDAEWHALAALATALARRDRGTTP